MTDPRLATQTARKATGHRTLPSHATLWESPWGPGVDLSGSGPASGSNATPHF